MYKKLISSMLVVALLNLVGCYSLEPITVPEYEQVEEKEGKPDEIHVKTINSEEYHYSDFYIENDTLYGKGKLLSDDWEQQLDRSIALSNIESIEVESLDWGNTLLFAGGITVGILAVAYLILLAVCSKPGSCGGR